MKYCNDEDETGAIEPNLTKGHDRGDPFENSRQHMGAVTMPSSTMLHPEDRHHRLHQTSDPTQDTSFKASGINARSHIDLQVPNTPQRNDREINNCIRSVDGDDETRSIDGSPSSSTGQPITGRGGRQVVTVSNALNAAPDEDVVSEPFAQTTAGVFVPSTATPTKLIQKVMDTKKNSRDWNEDCSPSSLGKSAAVRGRQVVTMSRALNDTASGLVVVSEPSQRATAGEFVPLSTAANKGTRNGPTGKRRNSGYGNNGSIEFSSPGTPTSPGGREVFTVASRGIPKGPTTRSKGKYRDRNNGSSEVIDSSEQNQTDGHFSDAPIDHRMDLDFVSDTEIATGAFHVTRDGQLVMREKANLPAHPPSNRENEAFDDVNNQDDTRLSHPAQGEKAKGTSPNPFYRSIKCKVLVLVLLVAAVAIGVAVPLSQQGGSQSNSSTSQNVSLRQEMARSVIQSLTFSQTLDDTSSPQNNAFNWIVQNDQLSPITSTSSALAIQKFITRYALATFYYSLGGDSWLKSTGWLNSNEDECSWDFVECDTSTGAVEAILISGNRLEGIVPPEVQLLSSLETLDLSTNTGVRGLPDELGNLSSIVELNFEGLGLKGSFPSMLIRLTRLVSLNLGGHAYVNGTLPDGLSKLSNLQTLLLGQNSLSGSVASQLHTMTALQSLDLSSNRLLSGNWQEITSGLYNLTLIRLYNVGNFVGNLDGIEKFRYLNELSIFENRLTGTIPTEFGLLTELTALHINGNLLTGSIPSELGRLANLTEFSLDGNSELAGSIPDSLCQLTELNEIAITPNIACNCSSKCTYP